MTDVVLPGNREEVRSRVVRHAAALLQEHGAAAVTTRSVAKAAGTQAPTIYRLFGDKAGLLDAVAEHVMTTYVATKVVAEEDRDADLDPLEDLRAGWSAQVDFGLSNPALFALLSDPSRGLRSPAARDGIAVLERRVHRLAVAGRLRVSERRAVELIRAAGTGAVLTILDQPADDRDLGLAEMMFQAALNAIVTDPPEPTEDRASSAVVAFSAIADDLDGLSAAEAGLLREWLDRVMTRLV